MNHDKVMWGNSTLFHRAKSIAKKYREKINIDTINQEKLFDRSADHI